MLTTYWLCAHVQLSLWWTTLIYSLSIKYQINSNKGSWTHKDELEAQSTEITHTGNNYMTEIVGMALGTQKSVDMCEFEANLVCIVSSRLARAIKWDPITKQTKRKKWKKKEIVEVGEINGSLEAVSQYFSYLR